MQYLCAGLPRNQRGLQLARSTLTAETLAAIEAVDAAMMCRKVLEDVVDRTLPPLKLLVYNKSLYDSENHKFIGRQVKETAY